MKGQSRLHCTRDILSAFQLFPVDYFCIFQEDFIMTQRASPKIKSVVATTTICVIIGILCCNLPQVNSLGSECYTITGVDYRGTQNEIELSQNPDLLTSAVCLPWNTSAQSTKPRARERGIGNHNYCRNPDQDVLPWCKVAGIGGSESAWGYCHLPNCQVPGYLGCFPDKGQPSALDGISEIYKLMTVGACIQFCRNHGYRYAGLEAGHACYCGNNGYNRYGESSERGTNCAEKCFGNKGQPCGGDGYVDVYKTEIGACGTSSVLRSKSGELYSPGYPDFPASSGMMTSLSSAKVMTQKLKDKRGEAFQGDTVTSEIKTKPDLKCEWTVSIKQASKIDTIIRKIDPKGKLGGRIEIVADDGAVIVVTTTSSNVTSNDTSLKSRIVWIVDSTKSRNEVEVVVPKGNSGDHILERQQWSSDLAKRVWSRTVIPRTSKSMVSVVGGAFTVRFIRDPEMMTSLKSTYDLERHRSRGRKKSSGQEWSRFVIEYEATFPEGVTYEEADYDVPPIDDVLNTRKNGGNPRRNKGHKKNRQNKETNNQDSNDFTVGLSLQNTRFKISQEDAQVIKEIALSGGAGSDVEDGSNSPIKIEVIVEPVPGVPSDRPKEEKMSEFTVPLLLAVLLTTIAILILSAVLLMYRRNSSKKAQKPDQNYSRGLVVSCPRDGDGEKSVSTSNLSSNSTTDSVLLQDSEYSKYSPKFTRHSVSPTTIKDLMEFLKNQSGLMHNHPVVDSEQYKQISQNFNGFGSIPENSRHDLRPDDVTPLPGPCPHCCGCAEENRMHRHGDSCRAHHNQGKHGKPQSSSAARSSGSKNTRGLTIRSCKSIVGAQQNLAPPLSPISEVSSVTSSMMSLPVTSNSQTSLLKQTPKSTPRKSQRNDLGPESEAFLTQESDAESGIGDAPIVPKSESSPHRAPKLRFNDNVSEKTVPGRYLGGAAGACYDSGYATSNYEEDDEKTKNDVIIKDNKNYPFQGNSELESSRFIDP